MKLIKYIGGIILVAILVSAAYAAGQQDPIKPEKTRAAGKTTDTAKMDSDSDGIPDSEDARPNVNDSGEGPTIPEEPEPTPEPVIEEDPQGQFTLNCDYELGDFGDSGDPNLGFRFIAGGDIRNTGNVGLVVRVTYRWKMLGQPTVKVSKNYRLSVDKTREIDFSMPVTGEQIDAHQSADGECSARAKYIDTFGAPTT
jgi:hypothetical protein